MMASLFSLTPPPPPCVAAAIDAEADVDASEEDACSGTGVGSILDRI